MTLDQLREAIELLERVDRLAQHLDVNDYEKVKHKLDHTKNEFKARLGRREREMLREYREQNNG